MRLLPILFVLSALAGCATTPKYSCGAPIHTGGCRSVSRIYAAAGQVPTHLAPEAAPHAPLLPVPQLGSMVMSAPRTLNIRVLPFQDGEGDMHGATEIHTRIGDGEWVIVAPAN